MNMSACMGRGDAAFWLRAACHATGDRHLPAEIATLLVGEADSLTRGFGEVLCAFKGVPTDE